MGEVVWLIVLGAGAVVGAIVIGLLGGLATNEAADLCEWLKHRLIQWTVSGVPPEAQARYREEILACVDEWPTRITRVVKAFDLYRKRRALAAAAAESLEPAPKAVGTVSDSATFYPPRQIVVREPAQTVGLSILRLWKKLVHMREVDFWDFALQATLTVLVLDAVVRLFGSLFAYFL